jgi:dihydroorotate dehydrogenase (NAD+) catalytic subunit
MVGSGTFGLGWELSGVVDLARLGAIIPKTVTKDPRKGNPPPRTVETPAGLLNSIGLDNDGIDVFLDHYLPRLRSLGCPIIISIAGKSIEEFGDLASRVEAVGGVAGLELNISCPNVAGGVDFATDPLLCARVVELARSRSSLPILAKLTPNVTNIVVIARAAWEAGADAVVIANTLLGMSVDWRGRRVRLGGILGGLSGPAVKPVALRAVFQVARELPVPIVASGGIGTIDDCMEFLVTGASAIQVGTANFYHPPAALEILERLPAAVQSLGARSVREIVGSLRPLEELRTWKP